MRIHGIDIAELVKEQIIEKCKSDLNLKLIDIGPLEMLSHPDTLAGSVPAVIVEPQEMPFEHDPGGDLIDFTLDFLIHYIYSVQEGEHPATVAARNAEEIARVLEEFEKVGDPTYQDMRVKSSRVTKMNYSTDFTRAFWMAHLNFAGMQISYQVTGELISD